MADDTNIAALGHNHPPAHLAFIEQANDLKEEARAWLDGNEISNEKEAEGVAKLKQLATAIEKDAETARKALTKPLDDQKKAIMADFKLVDDACALIKNTSQKALTVWLTKQAAEKAERERLERERLEQERLALIASQSTVHSLDEAEAMQDAITDHLASQKALERDSKQTVKASGLGRSVGLRTVYDIEVTDPKALAGWLWVNARADLMEYMTDYARKIVRAQSGNATIAGVSVVKSQVAV